MLYARPKDGIEAFRKFGTMRRNLISWLLAGLAAGCAPEAAAPPAELVVDDPAAFPENITSTRDGTLIISSVGAGGLFRAAPGAVTATRWIAAGDNGLLDTFGVLADEASNTLWVCSSRMDAPDPGAAVPAPALYNYDLKAGSFRSRFMLPGGTGLCNDIAIGPDKAVYVADTVGGRILRLAPGRRALEEWSTAKDLAGADGLDFLGRNLFVNSFTTGRILRLELKANGSAGQPVVLTTSRPLEQPDGMRRLGDDRLVLAQGSGTVDLLTVKGDRIEIETLRSGLAGPAGVTILGDKLWVSEARLSDRGKLRATSRPFKVYAIPLPASANERSHR